MRSSRAPAEETNSEKSARKRMAAYAKRLCLSRTRFMQDALLLGRRRAGCIEAHLGRFAFGGSGHFEELARFKAEHIGNDVGWKLLDLGVEVAHHGIVVAAGVLHRVLDLGEGALERREALDSAELGVRLGQ